MAQCVGTDGDIKLERIVHKVEKEDKDGNKIIKEVRTPKTSVGEISAILTEIRKEL